MARIRSLLSVAVLLGLVSLAANAESVVLRYKFVPQQELAYDLWATGEVSITGLPLPPPGGQSGKSEMPAMKFDMNGRYTMPVRAVDAVGNGTVGLRLDSLRMAMTMFDQSFHVVLDPARGLVQTEGKTEQVPVAELRKALAAWEKVSLTMSPRGQLLAASGLEELVNSQAGMGPMPMMGGGFSSTDFEKLLKDIPPWLPEGPVAVGDTWAVQMAMPMPGLAAEPLPRFTINYTLERFGEIEGHRLARIGFSGELAPTELAMPGPFGPGVADLKTTIQESLAGQLYFDLDTGQMRSGRGDMTATVKVSVSGVSPSEGEGNEPSGVASEPLNMQVGVKAHFEVSPAA